MQHQVTFFDDSRRGGQSHQDYLSIPGKWNDTQGDRDSPDGMDRGGGPEGMLNDYVAIGKHSQKVT